MITENTSIKQDLEQMEGFNGLDVYFKDGSVVTMKDREDIYRLQELAEQNGFTCKFSLQRV